MADYEGIPINREFIESSQKNYCKFPDKRDRFIIRFFVKYGHIDPRLFPVCSYCGKVNSRKHRVEECQEERTKKNRELLRERLQNLMGEEEEERKERTIGLERILLEIYFCPRVEWEVKTVQELLKWYCTGFYLDRP